MRLSAALVLGIALLAVPRSASAQDRHMTRLADGYLFVDGQYVAPPYNVRRTDRGININGRVLEKSFFGLKDDSSPSSKSRVRVDRGAQRGSKTKGGRGSRAPDPLVKIKNQLNQVTYGAIVILSPECEPLTLYSSGGGHQLLAALLDKPGSDMVAPAHFTAKQRASWDRLMASFQPDDAFTVRATAELSKYEAAAMDGRRISEANILAAQLAYPLTVFGMVVVVLAFGHLLSNRPELKVENEDQGGHQQVVVKSLLIIALFSALDLVWTLSASSAGSMRELNPLGSRFIEDPTLLVAFKLMVTGASIAILYALQRRPIAQVASWWCCLLLTLLTARWVVFQSMFA